MILRNHGLLTVGPTIPDAFLAMYVLESSCQIQLAAQAGGELIHVEPGIQRDTAEVVRVATGGMGARIAWPALLRKLDRVDPDYKN